MKEELRYTTMVSGVQYAVMDGMIVILLWCVHNWDLNHQQYQSNICQEQAEYFWIM